MSTTMLSSQQRHAFAGVHTFSRNVYISSFFRRGKKKMWNLVLKNERFLQLFSELGLFSNITDDAIAILEELVCCLYRDLKIKKLANWEWSYSKPALMETEKILIWLVYHVTATCISKSIELVTSQIYFVNQDVWCC